MRPPSQDPIEVVIELDEPELTPQDDHSAAAARQELRLEGFALLRDLAMDSGD